MPQSYNNFPILGTSQREIFQFQPYFPSFFWTTVNLERFIELVVKHSSVPD